VRQWFYDAVPSLGPVHDLQQLQLYAAAPFFDLAHGLMLCARLPKR
jgi:hypothetical protein